MSTLPTVPCAGGRVLGGWGQLRRHRDESYGPEIASWIQLLDGSTVSADEIREFRRTHLAHFELPKRPRFVAGFPMTATNKLRKFRMQELKAQDQASAA